MAKLFKVTIQPHNYSATTEAIQIVANTIRQAHDRADQYIQKNWRYGTPHIICLTEFADNIVVAK
jgi:hypothetical protein